MDEFNRNTNGVLQGGKSIGSGTAGVKKIYEMARCTGAFLVTNHLKEKKD